MSERACILRLDRTTANGTVLDGIADVGPDERGMSYLGARVQCPACGSIGHIVANGPRSEDDAIDDRLPALEGDLCRCRCNPPPILIASQHDWTYEG
ncbi:PAAR domain-containing protein [Paraburkholderia sp. FT54]|uniref:PAAR domain-containing protein n=1 Tax=Paraburkholderia sp. FT54 TaxID=3074437 RepID=UPI002877CFAE|nr:PAAR domain-containing protein [Paraburkholderia sp. FT54]WNC88578.1 PAAR domain-containing protein [Paraburkholderia sp. FT54]